MPAKAPKPIPEGMHSITTELWYNGNCREAVDFYKKAFNASQVGDIAFGPDGNVIHAMLKIGDSNIILADAFPDNWETGPQNNSTASLYLYVEDCDQVFRQAVNAGCKVISEPMDAFWGDRNGRIRDPFGHCWDISTLKYIVSPEEMQKGMEEWMKSVV